MPKFKVGDRVRFLATGYKNQTGTIKNSMYPNWEYTVTPDVPTRNTVPVHEHEIELVAPPLFRKGDKVLVEFTVAEDQTKEFSVLCTTPGMGLHRRSIAMLNAGTITRAPEPPYVPQPGDKFYGYPGHCRDPYIAVFVDNKTAVIDRDNGQRIIVDRVNGEDAYMMEEPRPA